MNRRFASVALAAVCLLPAAARAELVKLDVLRREPYAGGAAFGDSGPYEVIVGVGRYAVDPAHAHFRVTRSGQVDGRAMRSTASLGRLHAGSASCAASQP